MFEVPLNKQQQAQGHDDHAGDHAVNGQVMFTVFLGRRQQFLQGNKDHNPGDHGKKDSKNQLVEKLEKNGVPDHCPQGFGYPGEKRIEKGLLAAAGGIIDGNRGQNYFRNLYVESVESGAFSI